MLIIVFNYDFKMWIMIEVGLDTLIELVWFLFLFLFFVLYGAKGWENCLWIFFCDRVTIIVNCNIRIIHKNYESWNCVWSLNIFLNCIIFTNLFLRRKKKTSFLLFTLRIEIIKGGDNVVALLHLPRTSPTQT